MSKLQELPEQWQGTKKLALTVKQQVAPLQAAEVTCIRKKIAIFDTHIMYYREVFKRYDVSWNFLQMIIILFSIRYIYENEAFIPKYLICILWGPDNSISVWSVVTETTKDQKY